ncbi:GntP family permease [Alkaliphilus pronyensis]|uniref:GntP family permease n=1 Tax=Alkaliphilus pronyensis TaxID=1482732 RepID=A0A6I0FB60_9FIRM|nr:GntP family permease [Alkaliphilus pronyensis]KAB3535215.1 GntP family permease [Alkaliphilus pronyensis]
MVSSNVLVTLMDFLGIIILLLLLIAKYKWHVFYAMLIPLILFSVLPGVSIPDFIDAFEKGFGKTLGSIGVIVVLGSIMAEALKHTGAIETITKSMIKLVGEKRMPLALTLSGFVLGIAVFSDIAYVILNPLVHSAAAASGVSMATMSAGLVGALQLTHALVPPTPGPLAAAALIGADVGLIIIYGGVVCFTGSLAAWIWGQYIVGPRIVAPPAEEFLTSSLLNKDPNKASGEAPNTINSYAPIVIPIVLIATASVVKFAFPEDHGIQSIFEFLGWPVVALAIGDWLSYRNITSKDHKEAAKNKWVEDGLRTSAMILVVTGLGGSLSTIIRGTPTVDAIADWITTTGVSPIILPFLIGVIGNMITGSTTVGVITAGAIVAPMLSQLGLTPEAAMLAGASGSVIIKYVNSSYFWVVTTLSKMEIRNALITYGGATFFGGLVSFLTTWALWAAGLI